MPTPERQIQRGINENAAAFLFGVSGDLPGANYTPDGIAHQLAVSRQHTFIDSGVVNGYRGRFHRIVQETDTGPLFPQITPVLTFRDYSVKPHDPTYQPYGEVTLDVKPTHIREEGVPFLQSYTLIGVADRAMQQFFYTGKILADDEQVRLREIRKRVDFPVRVSSGDFVVGQAQMNDGLASQQGKVYFSSNKKIAEIDGMVYGIEKKRSDVMTPARIIQSVVQAGFLIDATQQERSQKASPVLTELESVQFLSPVSVGDRLSVNVAVASQGPGYSGSGIVTVNDKEVALINGFSCIVVQGKELFQSSMIESEKSREDRAA